MHSLTTFVAAFSCIAFAPLGAEAYDCTGMGRRYCSNESPAHITKSECPKPCQRDRCEGRRSTELERNGAQRDDRNGGTPTWEEVAFSGAHTFALLPFFHCYGLDRRRLMDRSVGQPSGWRKTPLPRTHE